MRIRRYKRLLKEALSHMGELALVSMVVLTMLLGVPIVCAVLGIE